MPAFGDGIDEYCCTGALVVVSTGAVGDCGIDFADSPAKPCSSCAFGIVVVGSVPGELIAAPPTGGTAPNRPSAALPTCSAFEPKGIVGAPGITDAGAPGIPPGDATFDAGIPNPPGRPGATDVIDDVGRFGARSIDSEVGNQPNEGVSEADDEVDDAVTGAEDAGIEVGAAGTAALDAGIDPRVPATGVPDDAGTEPWCHAVSSVWRW